MKNNKELFQYYLYGVFPALIIFAIVALAIHFMAASFFMLGFIWPYSYYTPGLKEKLSENPRKLSLLSMSYRGHDYLFNKVNNKKIHFCIRGFYPLIFVGALSLISFNNYYLWAVGGWLYFEAYFAALRIKKAKLTES